MIKLVAGVAGLALIGGGYFYDHSDSFKTECAIHKLTGADMGMVKNVICDVDFTLDG